jgi:hypothetical protein
VINEVFVLPCPVLCNLQCDNGRNKEQADVHMHRRTKNNLKGRDKYRNKGIKSRDGHIYRQWR